MFSHIFIDFGQNLGWVFLETTLYARLPPKTKWSPFEPFGCTLKEAPHGFSDRNSQN